MQSFGINFKRFGLLMWAKFTSSKAHRRGLSNLQILKLNLQIFANQTLSFDINLKRFDLGGLREFGPLFNNSKAVYLQILKTSRSTNYLQNIDGALK